MSIVPPNTQVNNAELSVCMTIVIAFLAHGFVNSALLTAWNPIRCVYWNLQHCSNDQSWMLNWLAFAQFHVFVLITCLTVQARGVVVLEQRIVTLCAALMVSILQSGIFLLDELNKPIAAVQVVIYIGFLSLLAYQAATGPLVVPLPPAHVRSSSFDRRRKMAIPTLALVIQALLQVLRVVDMTFGSGRDMYLGDTSSLIYQHMSGASVGLMMWAAIILGGTILLGTIEQHRALLVGQAIVLFVSHAMLTGEQGKMIVEDQAQAAGWGTFFSIMICLLGAY